MMMADRLPPHNIAAEEAVLGSALIDPEAIEKVAMTLSAADFYRERNRWIYEAMMACRSAGEPVDHLTVYAQLEATGRLEEAGGPAYLSHVANATPTSVHAEHYAGIVHRQALQRSAISGAADIADMAYSETDPAEIGERMLAAGLNLLKGNDTYRHLRPISEAVDGHYEHIREWFTSLTVSYGLRTGLGALDQKIGGLLPGQLVVFGARPSIGKTQLMLTIAINIARAGGRVHIFSLEMSEEELIKRMVSMRLATNVRLLGLVERADMEGDVTDALGWISDLPIELTEAVAFTTDDIRAQVLQSVRRGNPPKVVVVDYLHLLDDGRERGDSVASHIGHMTRRLKRLAMEAGVTVIVASQLNRESEKGGDLRPSLRHLRDSGSIEQDADVVGLLYRQDYYVERGDIPPDAGDPRYKPEDRRTLEINIAKQREGPAGTVKVYYDPAKAMITDFDHAREAVRYA